MFCWSRPIKYVFLTFLISEVKNFLITFPRGERENKTIFSLSFFTISKVLEVTLTRSVCCVTFSIVKMLERKTMHKQDRYTKGTSETHIQTIIVTG